VTSSIGVCSGEACRKINVDQSIEDFVHHNQAAVMTTLLWPLEVAQHCSDTTVGVVVGFFADRIDVVVEAQFGVDMVMPRYLAASTASSA